MRPNVSTTRSRRLCLLTKADIQRDFAAFHPIPDKGIVHFIGIGGAGMSSLARLLILRGREVSGSDLSDSNDLRRLQEFGAKTFVGHAAKHVEGVSLVVASDAIDYRTNPEFIAAIDARIPVVRRSQLLGQMVRGRRVIAVAGTHGKSSVSAALAQLLQRAGKDPLAIIGAEVPGFEGGVLPGEGEWAVVEACEAFNGMLDIVPETAVLTNLEPDHIEFHGSYESLVQDMRKFIQSATGTTKLVYCIESASAAELADSVGGAIPYGFNLDPWRAQYDGSFTLFGVQTPLKSIGRHNALNLLGAMTCASLAGVSAQDLADFAPSVEPCNRRLQIVGEKFGVALIADYAHHPTEIRASLDSVREAYPGRRIVCVYQPLTYARVLAHLNEFVEELSRCDFVVMTDIYSSREDPIPGVSSARIVEGLEQRGTQVRYVPSIRDLPKLVAQWLEPGDVVLDTGAAATGGFLTKLVEELDRRDEPLRIAVLCGGESPEREVSKLGGSLVANALKGRGYAVDVLDPVEILRGEGDRNALIGRDRPDIVFPILHGPGDEDGRVQAYLELIGMPYVGSGVLASGLAMDKEATRIRLAAAGLPIPTGKLVTRPEEAFGCPLPAIVKPNRQGSTIGITVVRRPEEFPSAVEQALKYDSAVLVEELIEGIEITVPVLGEEALPTVEIVPLSGFYDFEAKYTPGATQEIAPARIGPDLTKRAQDYAIQAHNVLGCLDFSRTDMMIRGNDIFILETNTIPGMTPTSLVPRSAQAIGLSFEELCERMLTLALNRYGIEKKTANA